MFKVKFLDDDGVTTERDIDADHYIQSQDDRVTFFKNDVKVKMFKPGTWFSIEEFTSDD